MIKIMKNTSRNSVYFIVVSVLAILGITLASALSIKKSTDVNVYPVITLPITLISIGDYAFYNTSLILLVYQIM